MFVRFHEKLKEREDGFTLIELLVVILIIAILAAIAIPVFLNQRKKGWVSQSKSALKNAATAMETCATESNGSYNGCDPTAHGFNPTADVTVTVPTATDTEYCLLAQHDLLAGEAEEFHTYDSNVGEPVEGDNC